MESMKMFARIFYIIDPEESYFQSYEQVPHYFDQMWSYFLVLMLLENVILYCKRKPIYRINDGLTSISLGIIHGCGRIMFRGIEYYIYAKLHESIKVVDLPWNSPITWYLAAIGIDFCYYWFHRMSHEIGILWSQHQVHHSSEEFNLAVGLRQSIVQGFFTFIFYLPLSVAVPPIQFVAHQEFNLIYQFWIHTKTVKTLGILEFLFNTPRHHRVHHGCNPYCLDKNYGGVLIIWDRIFGTFRQEDEQEEIVYGLVFNQPSFNILHLLSFYTVYVFGRFKSMESWSNKFKSLFFGPSWEPGGPRLGDENNKVKIEPRKKYNVTLPRWCNIYILIHFALIYYVYQVLLSKHIGMSPCSVFLFQASLVLSLTIFGLLLENKSYAYLLEYVRCTILVILIQRKLLIDVNPKFALLTEVFFFVSSLLCLLHVVNCYSNSLRKYFVVNSNNNND